MPHSLSKPYFNKAAYVKVSFNIDGSKSLDSKQPRDIRLCLELELEEYKQKMRVHRL